MEKEEEERAMAAAQIDPRDRTWSGMVTKESSSDWGHSDDSKPRYSDYRDSVVAIVTDVVRFKAQLPIGKSETGNEDANKSVSRRKDAKQGPHATRTEQPPTHNPTSDKKSLLITAL